MKHLFTLVLYMLVCSQVIAQESRLLNGKVTASDNNEPLIGVNIFLNDRWDIGTTTNLDGKFSLLISKKYIDDSIIFSYLGHKEMKLALMNVIDSKSLHVKLVQNAQTIDEVVVKAERLIAEEFTFKKVKRIEVYKNPSAKADPLLAVNSMPAATTTDESANISLRGSGPEETGIFFNNVPIYDAVRFSQLNGIGTFSIFNTMIVKDLQVFPGNPPLEYGSTTSGLIAISSEEQIPIVNNYSLALSLANVALSAHLKSSEKSSLTVFSNYTPSGLITNINQEALKSIKKFSSIDFGVHYYHRINSNTHLKLFNYSIKESYLFDYNSPTFNGAFKQEKKRNFTIANFRKSREKSEVTFNGGASFSDANFDYSKANFEVANQDLFASINYQYFGEKIGFKTGLNHDARTQNFGGSIPIYSFAVGESHPFIETSAEEKVPVTEYYAYLKYYLSEHWIIGTGLRKNIPNKHQKNYLSSQLNIYNQVSDYWSIKASIGNYNKYSFAQNQGTENYLISSKQADVNLNRKGKKIEHNLAVFLKETKISSIKNRVLGVEYFLEGKISSKLKGRVSYTYLHANITEEQQVTYPSKYDFNYFIKGVIEYQFASNWTISTSFLSRQGSYYQPLASIDYWVELDAYQPQYANTENSTRYSDYKLIDLNISRIIPASEKLTIIAFASLNNVFDFHNIRAYEYNHDYSEREESYYARRLIYFGAMFNF